jgi:hypothetical protein
MSWSIAYGNTVPRRPVDDSVADSVNPIGAAWNIWRAMRRTRPPRPAGAGVLDHSAFRPVLQAVEEGGVRAIDDTASQLEEYLAYLGRQSPDRLTTQHSLAFWVNLYNGHALSLAARAHRQGRPSVLAVADAFDGTVVAIDGEDLSLDAIEHGKIRRFGDARIHGALVCGSVSCPTLRFEPFAGESIDDQLDDQLMSFLGGGGATLTDGVLRLSRVFYWYSGDFVRGPPTWLPASKRAVVESITPWLPQGWAAASDIGYMGYDWGLACEVR